MRFVIHIGPDTIGLKAKSLASAEKALRRSLPKRNPKRIDSCDYIFKGRRYSYIEMVEAEIMSINAWFKAVEV